MSNRKQRAAGTSAAAALIALILVGCTAGADPSASTSTPAASSSPSPSAGVQQPMDPAEVPPIETTPPVIPTNEPGRQDSVLKSLPGESGSECVKVDGERDVRSESMAAGNFKDARAHYSESPKSEIPFYFIPSALEGDPELIVRIARTDGSGETEIKSSRIETADEWRYYPVQLVIPADGTWRIEASAGKNNTGCWEVAFKG